MQESLVEILRSMTERWITFQVQEYAETQANYVDYSNCIKVRGSQRREGKKEIVWSIL